MRRAAIIIPMTTSSEFLWLLNTTCVRTCKAYSGDADILILGNNSPDSVSHADLKKQCQLLGVRYEYIDGPFNQARFFNLGTDMTESRYVVYGSADLIFYPDWLNNLLDAYDRHQEYFMLAPWGFHPDMGALGYQQKIQYSKKIITTHWVSTGIEAMLRSRGYRFDEQFPDHELDTDYHYYAKSIGAPIGIVMNSRVDHLINGVRSQVSREANYGALADMGATTAALRKKWNITS